MVHSGCNYFSFWAIFLPFLSPPKKTGLPEHLFNMIPQSNHSYNTRSGEDVTTFYCRTYIFRYFYFPYTILEWNKLDMQIRKSELFLSFKNSLLKIGWPTAKPTYNIHNPIGLKFCVNPLCLCRLEIESLSHFFPQCHHFTNIQATLLEDLQSVDINIPSFSDIWFGGFTSLWNS